MRQRSERANQRTRERATTRRDGRAPRMRPAGLAVEGPGFLVWDEIASEARKRAAELMELAA